MFTPPKTYPSIRDVQALAPHTMWIPQVASSVTGAMGSPVSALNSIGANTTGHHFTQGASSARPTLQQDANGTRYLKFSGSQFMAVPSSTAKFNFLHDGTGGAIVAAFSVDDGFDTTQDIWGNGGAGSLVNRGSGITYAGTAALGRLVYRSNNGSTNVFSVDVLEGVQQGVDTISFASYETKTGDDAISTVISDAENTETQNSLATPSAGDAFGNLFLGRFYGSAVRFLRGKFYGIVIFDSVPSAAEKKLVVDMFAGMMRKQL